MSATQDNPGEHRSSPKGTANNLDLPLVGAATGPLSRWSTDGGEQYLDSIKAGTMAAQQGQDQTSPLSDTPAPPFEPLHSKAMRAAGIIHVTLPSRTTSKGEAASPATERHLAVAGLAAEAWEDAPGIGILSEYCPASWHDPRGIKKVLRRITPYLPDVTGALFLTLTYDRNRFAGPESAHNLGRPFIRKVMDRLRKGVEWQGKHYQFMAPYCVKVEFHDDEDGWPHYHLVVLTRRYVPVSLLAELWGNGLCHVRRIRNHDFHYLLKYVTKSGEYPEWVKSRMRLRVFQPSHGFMKPRPAKAVASVAQAKPKPKEIQSRASLTIGQRLHKWARMALFKKEGRFQTLALCRSFRELFDQLVLSIAESQRYLGNGFIKINRKNELIPWILNPAML